MDIFKIDPDYDCADTDNKFENLPKDEQDAARQRLAKAQELKKSKVHNNAEGKQQDQE